MQTLFSFFTKQATLMRRSTLLHLELVFHCYAMAEVTDNNEIGNFQLSFELQKTKVLILGGMKPKSAID
jgi:hypothetical protein